MPVQNKFLLLLSLAAFLAGTVGDRVMADGPADNLVENVRRIPQVGITLTTADRKELLDGLAALRNDIEKLRASDSKMVADLLPDVLIFHRAVEQAVWYKEFFDPSNVLSAKALLKEGQARASQLLTGTAPWTTQTGRVVRGYISKIDKTVQPYGLIIPANYDFNGKNKHRLDFWFHGRGEVLSEVNFINDRMKNDGAIKPDNTIVLHPYGRYCNANKLAGEIDSLEALDAVRKQYRVDDDRIAVRGFSMGGAAAWQFAVHYPDRWFAANPGAGFSETPDFLKVFQNETLTPTWYEQKLWRMYDCNGYAANLAHLPTIAYSGEIDRQKQAADVMAAAFEKEGMKLLHIIGPMTAHSIHKDSAKEIDAKLAEWATKGIDRNQVPLQFVTYTLRYNTMHWLTVDGLKQHWEEARVTARPDGDTLVIKTRNVSALTIRPPKSVRETMKRIAVDGSALIQVPQGEASISLALKDDAWSDEKPTGLRKQHGLQGPIDDAFLDSFIFVTPSGKCRSDAVDKWTKAELDHAVTQWRQQMRGDAIVKRDNEITEADLASSNIVLWGDSQANSLVAKISEKLPIDWSATKITAGDKSYDAANHALIAIYPNPLNPKKYVVLNSSFTYREYDYLNNARQVPKLPDWAIIDVRTPPNARHPGKVVDADFFDEEWKFKRSQ